MDDFFEVCSITGCILLVIIGFVVLVSLVLLPFKRMDTGCSVAEFKAIQTAVTDMRENNANPLESVAIQQKIVDANKELAGLQYWNSTIFDWWIDDAVMKLEPIH